MFNPESPPEFITQRWFNTDAPMTLASLKGKVVFVAAFQMHCEASLKHGLPQATRLAHSFNRDEVVVMALNTAFDEPDKQAAGALDVFVRAAGLAFPVAKDKPDGAKLPKTMAAYEIRGTPAILLFDRQGRLRRHYLGQVDDIRVAAEIMTMVIEDRDASRDQSIALERRMAAALVDPSEHAHEHDGDCCGGHGHDHSHDHGHDHDHVQAHDSAGHVHGDGCCGGAHGHSHDHTTDHGHGKTKPAKAAARGKAGR